MFDWDPAVRLCLYLLVDYLGIYLKSLFSTEKAIEESTKQLSYGKSTPMCTYLDEHRSGTTRKQDDFIDCVAKDRVWERQAQCQQGDFANYMRALHDLPDDAL